MSPENNVLSKLFAEIAKGVEGLTVKKTVAPAVLSKFVTCDIEESLSRVTDLFFNLPAEECPQVANCQMPYIEKNEFVLASHGNMRPFFMFLLLQEAEGETYCPRVNNRSIFVKDAKKNVRALCSRFLQNATENPDCHSMHGNLEYLVYSIRGCDPGDIHIDRGIFSQVQVKVGPEGSTEETSLQLQKYRCDPVEQVDIHLLAYILNEPTIFVHEVSCVEGQTIVDCWNVPLLPVWPALSIVDKSSTIDVVLFGGFLAQSNFQLLSIVDTLSTIDMLFISFDFS